ncbi:MAG: NifB/NifX family molybdenum-iron cluster-binding protein [Spirochaetes bacterium]|jgi:predicted Fe-Mo cluster-binding NifX family protein|nr:NifB/NifX family molybdenum-iron cluster-binding protein [Spirochaetota bacterium]
MTKLALPTRGSEVDGHFGHCERFTVFSVDNGKIVAEESVASPAGCGCKSDIAGVLAGMGVGVMLAGNMGQGAVNKLAMHGIRVVRGCSGGVRQAAEAYLAGSVKDSGNSCAAHDHGHECHGH